MRIRCKPRGLQLSVVVFNNGFVFDSVDSEGAGLCGVSGTVKSGRGQVHITGIKLKWPSHLNIRFELK